jgi:methylenetetrahydrofolate--tRNA-(uracil-5-)-methyltransferase
MLAGEEPVIPPPTTMLGALYRYLRDADPAHFQPMNANFGLVDDLPARVKDKKLKREQFAERALSDMKVFVDGISPQRAPSVQATVGTGP